MFPKCQAIRDSYNYLWYGQRSPGGGGPCTRWATYTDGKHHYCTQHAQQGATVRHKRSTKIRDGLTKLEPVAYIVKLRDQEQKRFADKVEAQRFLRRKIAYSQVNGKHDWTLEPTL